MRNRRITPKIILPALITVVIMIVLFYFLSDSRCPMRTPAKAEREMFKMGTIVRISLYGTSEKRLNEALDMTMGEISRLEALLSANVPSSDISKINRIAGERPVRVSEETGFLLERALEWSELTDGAFDPTVGRVVKLWGIGTDAAAVPDDALIRQTVSFTDFKKVSVTHEQGETYVRTGIGQMIDLGGIAKGYATDRIIELLAKEGITSALIDLGGNIAVIGSLPNGREWKLGLQHPSKSRGEYFGTIGVTDTSVVTSGPYERYFESNGVRYHHIFDPRTGYPAGSDLESVTVISRCSTDADALSTALFVMGSEEGLLFLSGLENTDAVLVARKNGENLVYVTEGINKTFMLKSSDMKIERETGLAK